MPAPFSDDRCTIGPVLTAIAGQLVAKAVVQDPSRVVWSLRPTVPHFGAEQDVVLRPLAPSAVQGWIAAGGRVTTMITRVIQTVCRSRSQLDEAGRDRLW